MHCSCVRLRKAQQHLAQRTSDHRGSEKGRLCENDCAVYGLGVSDTLCKGNANPNESNAMPGRASGSGNQRLYEDSKK